MKKYIWMIVLCLLTSGFTHTVEAMHMGMNLGSIKDWTSDHAFIDVFKKSRDWMTRNADGSGSWDNRLGSKIIRWQDRTRPEHNTQARSTGVALEYMVQLANEL